MSELLARVLKDAFRRYYRSHSVPAPPNIDEREFGVGDYGRKIVRRHMSFATEREFQRYLREEAPLYISYSVGYFERPEATPMEAKGLKGADLIFEFDADELGLFSPKDIWICNHCGAKGFVSDLKGVRPGICPRCKDPAKVIMFPDPEREERLKHEVDTLIKDFLMSDFGISSREISINFSGNRGYHIHVRSEALRQLDKEARVELTEYITGQSLDARYFFDVTSVPMRGPKPSDPGWPGRIARSVIQAIRSSKDVSDLVMLGVDPRMARRIMRERQTILDGILRGVWPFLSREKDVFASITALVRALSPFMGKEIDAGTSADIHRLIRVPGSLHGSTGLAAMPVSNLKAFNPYHDAVVLPERPYLHLHVDMVPEFEFAGQTYGPYVDKNIELPLHVSVFLISKGVARWSLATHD